MDSIIITGASGLIGTHLLEAIDKKTYRVYSVVNNNHVYGKGTEVLTGDLTENSFTKYLPKADYIIHGAGYAEPKRFLEDPIKTIKLNTTVLMALFEKLNDKGKLLYLSTSEVYSGAKPPYKETDIGTTNPSHPRACYIESKRCGEAICNSLGGKIARLSLVYGPGVSDGRVMYDFIKQALNGGIKLMDEGKAKRTYCYVTDAVEMLLNILFKGQGTYNVGGISRVTIKELALRIAEIVNVPVELGEKGLVGAPDDVQMDLSRIEKEFNKKEYVGLMEGLKKTIKMIM